MLADLKDVGADKGESIASLRQFDAQMFDSSDFLKLFDSVAGKADVFDLALTELAMTGPGVPAWAYRENINSLRAYIASLDMGESTILAAELCGVAPPPEIPFESAELTPMARSFYGESKRVRSALIRSELGVELRYPTYREGLTALRAGGEGPAG